MIICLSGFVIAGTSPTSIPVTSRNDISVVERLGGACERPLAPGGARYSPHHHQLLQHFAPPLAHRGVGRSSSSSAESVSSHSASPPPGAVPPPPALAPAPGAPPTLAPHPHAPLASVRPLNYNRYTRVRTLYACLGEGDGELSFEPNQIITNVAPSGEPGWLRGTLNGKTGLVPENYVEPLP
ncbi:rho GTPase-activating protein 26 [Manduca sexta]|nr:rho GTPase-activating protein 26 [Manduca sexta]